MSKLLGEVTIVCSTCDYYPSGNIGSTTTSDYESDPEQAVYLLNHIRTHDGHTLTVTYKGA